jgi:HAE1 family hydrophobic/amphiphilic exporter-1
MPAAEQQVRERLASLSLPTGVAAPVVSRFSMNSIPILTMAVFGDDPAATEDYVDDELLPALEATTGVGAVSKSGGSNQLVAVVVDPAALAQAGLSPSLVAQALAAANLSVPVGGVAIDGTQFPVRVSSTPDTLDEVKAVPVGAGFTLGDVALVTLTDANSGTTISRTDGRPSIGLEIVKEQGANTLDIDAAIQKVLAESPPPAGVTILALIPLALGFSQGALLSTSLATVVIGGLFSSTLLTLLVIPVVYSLLDGLRRRLTRRHQAAPAPAEG